MAYRDSDLRNPDHSYNRWNHHRCPITQETQGQHLVRYSLWRSGWRSGGSGITRTRHRRPDSPRDARRYDRDGAGGYIP